MTKIPSIDELYELVRGVVGVGYSATPVPAVACVLWRAHLAELQVYLVKRNPRLPFAGGMWAFPGGKVEATDATVLDALRREVEEETGARLPSDGCAYMSAGRWVTPDFSPIRYDARYFAHRVAADVTLDWRRSDDELVDGRWTSVEAAEERWRRGEWLVLSPIRRVLLALAEWHAAGEDEPALARRMEEAAASEDEMARVWQLADGVGVCPVVTPTLPPATHTNCYLLGQREVVVCDPATPDASEQQVLIDAIDCFRGHGVVGCVVLTHHHGDHVGAAHRVAEHYQVPIAAHAETASRLAGQLSVDRHLEHGDVLELADGREIEVVFTPGHAPGHLCFVDRPTGFVVVGDMLAGVGTILIDPSEGNMREYLRSLDALSELESPALLPAHGGVIADPASRLREYRRHRLWREAQVLEALRELGPATSMELTMRAYRDVPVRVHLLAERSLLSHLEKLRVDGLARSENGRWQVVR